MPLLQEINLRYFGTTSQKVYFEDGYFSQLLEKRKASTRTRNKGIEWGTWEKQKTFKVKNKRGFYEKGFSCRY